MKQRSDANNIENINNNNNIHGKSNNEVNTFCTRRTLTAAKGKCDRHENDNELTEERLGHVVTPEEFFCFNRLRASASRLTFSLLLLALLEEVGGVRFVRVGAVTSHCVGGERRGTANSLAMAVHHSTSHL